VLSDELQGVHTELLKYTAMKHREAKKNSRGY
jgi:hypothetical protein